eukprot:Phypoly_transcript_04435.p1 GENE.Phypoly_transcript_04435~~Phypoly_transcript_04435.p1  ORF type:complete len:688 (+),score=101.45 Phypoly_transcript_04435:123-2066(+)
MAPSFPPYHFDKINTDEWWLGEKYDGVRCCWNSDRKKVYARTGKEIQLPEQFTELLPSIYLDSEIWFGRGGFQDSVGVIKGTTPFFQWPSLRLIAFDIPLSSLQEPYEERYAVLLQSSAQNHAFLVISGRAMHHMDNLYWFVQYVIDGGGEGVILQKRGSVYERGRSLSLIKLKTAAGDQEAIVIGVGDHKSVHLKLPTGLTFTVPAENVHIPTPAPGDIVSFSYEANSRYDLPTNPQIYRIRGDVSWDDVVHSFFKEKQFLNEASIHAQGSTALPKSHWNLRTIRDFMVRFAKSRNLDPYSQETWQSSAKAFRTSVNGKKILKKFKNKYYLLVQKIFPEISLWHKSTDKKKFLERYGKARGFDVLKAEDWYLHLKKVRMSEKGMRRFAKALQDAFPNIGLDKSKLQVMQSPYGKWENRRNFFEKYAKLNAFDPQIPANWYAQSRDKIMSVKGAQEVLLHYGNSLSKALLDLFPTIGLDVTKFHVHRLAMWHKIENRKKFFETYAIQNGFDHRQAQNWYTQPREKVLAVKGARGVIAYHGQSISRALMDLFPDIGLDKTKFRVQKFSWDNPENRKNFFEKYALAHRFDPLHPEEWYAQSHARFTSTKGAPVILSYHKNSIACALVDLFPNIGLEISKLSHLQQTVSL